jgi:hypothetical protein
VNLNVLTEFEGILTTYFDAKLKEYECVEVFYEEFSRVTNSAVPCVFELVLSYFPTSLTHPFVKKKDMREYLLEMKHKLLFQVHDFVVAPPLRCADRIFQDYVFASVLHECTLHSTAFQVLIRSPVYGYYKELMSPSSKHVLSWKWGMFSDQDKRVLGLLPWRAPKRDLECRFLFFFCHHHQKVYLHTELNTKTPKQHFCEACNRLGNEKLLSWKVLEASKDL